jgi:outer membrane protein OmpU
MTETEGKIMKKILIATTALVATAGVAAADVNLSGYARFGMVWNEGAAAVPGTAAVQGVHTAATAAVVGEGVIAGDAVTVEDYVLLQDESALAAEDLALAIDNAVSARSTGLLADYAAWQVARDAAVAAQDAAAIAELDTLQAQVLADVELEAEAAADAAALLSAAAGVAAVPATAAGEDTTGVASRLRIQFDMSTTTDAGVGLNVRQRFQAEENGGGTGGNGARFGLTYGGFAVNFGNINGVIESTPNLYMRTNSAGVGLEGNGFHSLVLGSWTAYSSGGAGATDGVEVIYSANGVRVHAHDTAAATAYGASVSMGDVTVGAAYEDFDAGGSATLLTAGMNIGAGWVAVAHGIQESAAGVDTTETALKGGYDIMPGANLYGFVKSADAGDAAGIGMSYDLGGGASFDAGYTNTAADLGILSAGIFFTF